MMNGFARRFLVIALAVITPLPLGCSTAPLFTARTGGGPSPLPQGNALRSVLGEGSPGTVSAPGRPAESSAATPGRFPETLYGYLRSALENNAELRGSFAAYQAALKKRPYVTALADPRLTYGYFLRSVETRTGAQQHRLGISQAFPWFGTLTLRGDEADFEARAAFSRFLSLKNKLVFDVARTYAELAYLQAAVRIAEETLQLVQSWEKVLQVRFRSGIGTHSDLVRVQTELGQLEDHLAEFREVRQPTQAAFNALLNRPTTTPVHLPPRLLLDPALDAEASAARQLTEETVLTGNPELARFDALIQARRVGVELAGKTAYPDFTLGLDYIATDKRPGPTDSGKDALLPTLSMTLPIYWQKNQARVEEAVLRQYSIEEQRRNSAAVLASDFARARFALRDAERKTALFTHTLLPKAEESIEASFTAYESGAAGFLDVLDSGRRLLDFELSLSRARTDRAIAIAKLFMLRGGYSDFLSAEERGR